MDNLPVMPVSGPVISISLNAASNAARFAGNLQQTSVSKKAAYVRLQTLESNFFFYSGI
jgi:hypothetical protein